MNGFTWKDYTYNLEEQKFMKNLLIVLIRKIYLKLVW